MTGKAPVAQLDRALPSEGKGQKFESSRARQKIKCLGDLSALRKSLLATTQQPTFRLVGDPALFIRARQVQRLAIAVERRPQQAQ
jgi:hypothetical protein